MAGYHYRSAASHVGQCRPAELHDFVRTAQELQLEPHPGAATPAPAVQQDRRHWQGTSGKKRTEIEGMAGAIVACAAQAGCSGLTS